MIAKTAMLRALYKEFSVQLEGFVQIAIYQVLSGSTHFSLFAPPACFRIRV